MSLLRNTGKALGGLIALGVVIAPFFVLCNGPRMRVQPSIRAYQAVLPPMPAGTVPIASPLPGVPSTQAAEHLTNPAIPDASTLAAGKVYYTYYCLACHGEAGDGTGPVGDSYWPRPTTLSDPKVRASSDGVLLRAMLTGVGHDPILGRIVPSEHRWPLVLFVRQLQSGRTVP